YFGFEPSWFDRDPHPPEKKAWKIKKYAERNRTFYAARIQSNLNALGKVAEVCRRKALGLVLVELPLNRVALKEMGPDFMATYRRDMRDFARQSQVAYWEYPQLTLKPEEYYDANHVMKSARLKIEKATVEALRHCQSRPLYRLSTGSSEELFPPRVDCHLGDLG
ncbi:MAG: hypothetical protein R3B54_18240, partial [Bdellovibrionota bacterium]